VRTLTPRKKRPGTIALAAARPMTALAMGMDAPTAAAFVRSIHRWLDNGHSLDTADVEWLAAVAAAGVDVAPVA
jgi:hypothetical protein